MTAVILMDNRAENTEFKTEHGFSLYIETGHHKCLVDVGASDAFLFSAEKLGINIAEVDYLFLSHGHSDHMGGLPFFLEKNQKARIILSEYALKQKYYSVRKGVRRIYSDINIDSVYPRFWMISADTILEKDIRIITKVKNEYPRPQANQFLKKEEGGNLIADDFNHELIFCFGEKEQLVCTGCSHQGIQNILQAVRQKTSRPLTTVIGGFHLLDADGQNQYETPWEIDKIARNLKSDYPDTEFYTGHCTGNEVFNRMEKVMSSNLQHFYVGKKITRKE